MQRKWISGLLALALTLAALIVMPAPRALAATTYYSTGSVTPNTLTNWKTARDGTGTSPANFTAGDVFVIQDGHNMTTSATWSISGTGSKLWIENGGTLTASSAVTLASATTFQIDAGGTYVHNNTGTPSSTVFQGTESFAASSTFEIQNWVKNSTQIPSGVSFGNLTINYTSSLGGSWNQSGTLLTVNGNLTISATGTSAQEFRLSGNTAYTLNIGGNLVVGGGILNLTNGIGVAASPMDLNIGGNFSQTGGTFTQTATNHISVVKFTGGTSTVTFSKSGGTFTNTNINWQIASGKTVELNTSFGAGSWVNSSRTMTVNGALQINQGAYPGTAGTWTYGAAGTLIFNNSSGSYGVNSEVWWPTSNGPVNVTVAGAGGLTMNVARTVSGIFQTAAGVTNANNLTLNGTAQINAGGYFNSSPTYGSSSTLIYNVGATYNISNEWVTGGTVGSGVPNNVTIQNSTAVALPNSAGSRSVPGNFTITSGSLTLGGTVGDDLNIGGNWVNSGTFNANSRTVTFNGSAAQQITGATSFAYLTLNNSSGLTLNNDVSVANQLTLTSGLLTLGTNNLTLGAAAPIGGTPSETAMVVATDSGELRKTFTGVGSFTFPVGDNTAPAEYSPVTLNFTSGAFSSAYAAVRLTDAKHASNTSTTDYVTRYWTVTSSGISGFSCAASFIYVDADITGTEANLYAGKYNGSTWTLLDAVDAGNNKLSGTVTSFSDFTGGEQAPLAAALSSFDATSYGDHILVAWETVSEVGNVGFNLWRGVSPNAPDVQLNASLIPSQGPGSSQGFSYAWPDSANLVNNTTYYYWLEDVDIAGVVTRHGPVSATYNAPTAVSLSGFTPVSALPVAWPLAAAGLTALAAAAVAWRRR